MDFPPAAEHASMQERLVAASKGIEAVERFAVSTSTTGVYAFRSRHPFWYGAIAFLVGGFVTAIFIASYCYTFESQQLLRAMYSFVFGSLAGSICAVILAFAYAGTMRPGALRPTGLMVPFSARNDRPAATDPQAQAGPMRSSADASTDTAAAEH